MMPIVSVKVGENAKIEVENKLGKGDRPDLDTAKVDGARRKNKERLLEILRR
jgi:fructose-1,6-bisphosphatase/sedoheptulose 1,7-bisphosphatase-like protein